MSGDEGLSCPPGRGSSSAGSAGQESPWSGLLSVVSRPALALLQRPLPVRPRSAPPPGERSQADWKNRLSDEERDVFRLLDNALAASPRCYLNSAEPRDKVLYDQDVGMMEGHASALLSQVWWSSEDPPQGSKTLLSSFLGGLSRRGVSQTAWLQLHQNLKERNLLAKTRTPGELLLALPSQSSATTCWPMREVGEHEQASPTSPDQDHGYSSLEEEFLHIHCLYLAEHTLQEEEQPTQSSSTKEEKEEEVKGVEPVEEEQVESLAPVPQCQNKSIAFIMGCPCSDDEDDDDSDDDSSSQSEGHSSDDDDDDDDGFDSEGSSDLSTSSGEDDPEAELLWASLCRSSDPYDPRNFTARLHTGPAPPRTPTPPPSSSPLPPPSPSPVDSWDDSTSASEAEEADSLWASFSCSSDPYSPLNFQATLRTCSGPSAAQQTPRSSRSSSSGPAPARRTDGGPSKIPSVSPCTKKVSELPNKHH